MALQWPLILFTTFLAWCAGTFSTQAYLALKGKGEKIQTTTWIVSAVLLVIAGIAVFMHLQHWERIFNGFGHITSGITQELIAIILLAVVAIIYLAQLRRNEGKAPKWIAILAIVFSVLLLIVAGNSYMMSARPAWNNILWILSIIGAACALGPATVGFIAALKGDDTVDLGTLTIVGVAVNAVTSLAAALSISSASSFITDVGWYYDLTQPTKKILTPDVSAFSADCIGYTVVGVIIIGIVVALIAALVGKKTGNWKIWAPVVVVCILVSAICLRAVFYINGVSLFMFY